MLLSSKASISSLHELFSLFLGEILYRTHYLLLIKKRKQA